MPVHVFQMAVHLALPMLTVLCLQIEPVWYVQSALALNECELPSCNGVKHGQTVLQALQQRIAYSQHHHLKPSKHSNTSWRMKG